MKISFCDCAGNPPLLAPSFSCPPVPACLPGDAFGTRTAAEARTARTRTRGLAATAATCKCRNQIMYSRSAYIIYLEGVQNGRARTAPRHGRSHSGPYRGRHLGQTGLSCSNHDPFFVDIGQVHSWIVCKFPMQLFHFVRSAVTVPLFLPGRWRRRGLQLRRPLRRIAVG